MQCDEKSVHNFSNRFAFSPSTAHNPECFLICSKQSIITFHVSGTQPLIEPDAHLWNWSAIRLNYNLKLSSSLVYWIDCLSAHTFISHNVNLLQFSMRQSCITFSILLRLMWGGKKAKKRSSHHNRSKNAFQCVNFFYQCIREWCVFFCASWFIDYCYCCCHSIWYDSL